MTSDTLKALWESLPATPIAFSPQQMKQKVSQFERRAKRQNAVEYLGYGILFIWSLYVAVKQNDVFSWIVAALLITGAAISLWNYRRNMRVESGESITGAHDLMSFHKRELTRKRDALKTAWKWYALPLMPAVIFILAGRWVQYGDGKLLELTSARTYTVLTALFCLSTFTAVILWQFLGAAKYQRQLDELDRYK